MDTKFGELDFNGVLIQLTQSDNFDMMINATEMWKSVGGNKNNQPYEFLRLPSTIEFINALKSILETSKEDLVRTIKGNFSDGTSPGTWFCEYFAVLYSKYLSTELLTKTISSISEFRINFLNNSVDILYNEDELIEFTSFLSELLEKSILIREDNEKLGFLLDGTVISNKDLLFTVLSTKDNIVILKTINILLKYFLNKGDDGLINCIYLMLPTILDNIISLKTVKLTEKQKTYLMNDSNTGYTKIGKTVNPKSRERTLQSEKPTISLFAICDDLVETKLHKQYESKRIRGEWFKLEENDINDILNNYKFIKQ